MQNIPLSLLLMHKKLLKCLCASLANSSIDPHILLRVSQHGANLPAGLEQQNLPSTRILTYSHTRFSPGDVSRSSIWQIMSLNICLEFLTWDDAMKHIILQNCNPGAHALHSCDRLCSSSTLNAHMICRATTRSAGPQSILISHKLAHEK